MSAAMLIERACADGLVLQVSDAGALQVTGPAASVERWLPALEREKPAILAALNGRERSRGKTTWRAIYDERVACGRETGLSGAAARANAYAGCLAEWLDRTFMPSDAVACALGEDCRRRHGPLLPYGVEQTGYVWLHPECRPLWAARRKIQAVKALAAAGVAASDDRNQSQNQNEE